MQPWSAVGPFPLVQLVGNWLLTCLPRSRSSQLMENPALVTLLSLCDHACGSLLHAVAKAFKFMGTQPTRPAGTEHTASRHDAATAVSCGVPQPLAGLRSTRWGPDA